MSMGASCRATSPDDDACVKVRGHKSHWHQGHQPGKRHATRRWEGGINTKPRWELVDDGYMTQADEDTWGRIFR